MKKYIFLAIFMVITIAAFTCDMAAMISEAGYNLAWRDSTSSSFDEQYDLIKFLETRSTSGTNPDGYGLLYYENDGTFGDIWHETETYDDEPGEMDEAHDVFIADSSDVKIIMGHDRHGTVGNGNHPFTLQLEGDDHVYSFMHNGGIQTGYDEKGDIYYFLDDNDWFDDYSSNWTQSTDPDNWIDSELLFHYIMYFIRETGNMPGIGYDTYGGICDALLSNLPDTTTPVFQYFAGTQIYNTINFILTDGEKLFVYRNSEVNYLDHNLSYEYNSSTHNYHVKTQNTDGTQMVQHSLLILSPQGILVLPGNSSTSGWRNQHMYVSGTIGSSTTWSNTAYICGNIYIPSGETFTLGVTATCYTPSTILVRDSLIIDDEAILKLDYHSEIIVEKPGAVLKFNFGSTLEGNVTGLNFETLNPSGKGYYIPGDIVTIRDSGKVDCQDYRGTPTQDDIITITKTGTQNWEGFQFYNTPTTSNYFRYANISGIYDISFEDSQQSGGIVVESRGLTFEDVEIDDIRLIYFEDSNRLRFKTHYRYPNLISDISNGIYLYNSAIRMDTTEVTDCNCIYINYSPADTVANYIGYSEISENSQYGLRIGGCDMKLHWTTIEDNDKYGIYANTGSFFCTSDGSPYDIGTRSIISNNGWMEYYGRYETFSWAGFDWSIEDDSYSTFYDQYLLWCISVPQGETIDVSGNDIDETDTSRFFPSYGDYYFGGKSGEEAESIFAMGYEAYIEEDYRTAEAYWSSVVVSYPETKAAIWSLNHLFYISKINGSSMSSFREYLNDIDEYEFLDLTKEDLITKSYIAEEDYSTAIDRLEYIINNSEDIYLVESALLDQAYCYKQLSDLGERNLPLNCHAKTSTMRELIEFNQQIFNHSGDYNDENIKYSKFIPLISRIDNYPNPFNPETTINFTLIEPSSNVSVKIYNIKGQLVQKLLDSELDKGAHQVVWKGDTVTGKPAGSGVYFYQINAGDKSETRKMMLIK